MLKFQPLSFAKTLQPQPSYRTMPLRAAAAPTLLPVRDCDPLRKLSDRSRPRDAIRQHPGDRPRGRAADQQHLAEATMSWVSDSYYARFGNFPPLLYWRGTVKGFQALMMQALERGTPLTASELMKV